MFGTTGPATVPRHRRSISAAEPLWEPPICPSITVFISCIIVWKHRCVSRAIYCTLTEEGISMDGKGGGAGAFLSSAFCSARLQLTVAFVASEAVVCTAWLVGTLGCRDHRSSSTQGLKWLTAERHCKGGSSRHCCPSPELQMVHLLCRSQWPGGLRRRSTAPRLPRLWVRIPRGAWMSLCCECCVFSGRGLCDALISRREESYRLWCVVVCDLETSRMRRSWPALGRSATVGWGINIHWAKRSHDVDGVIWVRTRTQDRLVWDQ